MKKLALLLFLILFTVQAFALTSMQVPAVATGGGGVMTIIEAKIDSGKGSTYVDIEPFISVDTQNSAKTAFRIAAEKAGVNYLKEDIFFKVTAESEVIDGPSGGAAFTLLAYSELTGEKLRSDLTVTGTIEPDGSIGRIGGVLEKLKAVKDAGLKVFVIPFGQLTDSGNDLTVFGEQWGIQVIEARNVDELLSYAFTPTGSKITVTERIEEPIILEKIETTPEQLPLKNIAEKGINDFAKILRELRKDGAKTPSVFEKALNESEFFLKQGYFYTSANNIFVNQLNAEALLNSNITKNEVIKLIQDLEKELYSMEFAGLNTGSIEWVSAAKLRYYWAENKLKLLQEDLDSYSPAQAFDTYTVAKNWFDASKQMNEEAKKLVGEPLSETNARGLALDLIKQVNLTKESGLLDPEEEDHLNTAIIAFSNGDYYASVFDVLYSVSFRSAREKISDNFGYKLESITKDKAFYDSGELSESVWAQYYFIHSLYHIAEYNRTQDFTYFINAVKLQELSMAWDVAKKELIQSNPNASQDFTINTQVIKENPGISLDTIFFALGVSAVVIIALLGFISISKKKSVLSPTQKLERLEELLLEKRISESTFKKLYEKYSPVKKSKPRLKRK
ncbi:MAG: S16 family serine protease [Candidatus Micrarchaeota archaeon]